MAEGQDRNEGPRCPHCRRELGTEMHKHLAEEHNRPRCARAEIDLYVGRVRDELEKTDGH